MVYVKLLSHILPRGSAFTTEVNGENRQPTGWKTNPISLERLILWVLVHCKPYLRYFNKFLVNYYILSFRFL